MSKHVEYYEQNVGNDEYDVDVEIYKMQQDIEARRNARKRMGISEDDESILVLEEKIKQLLPLQKRKESERRQIIIITLFIILVPLFLVILVLAPLILIALVAITLIIIIIRKLLRRKHPELP